MPLAQIEINGRAQKAIDEWREECKRNLDLLEPRPRLKIEKIEPTIGIDEEEVIIWIDLDEK